MTIARLESIQVGRVQTHAPPGPGGGLVAPWRSAFVKQPVSGPCRLGSSGLEGDEHADLRAHGGADRALLAYSADHYPRWEAELGLWGMGPGGFGENFTVRGADEHSVCVGDVVAAGHVRVQVSQPRSPCSNISKRWGRPDLMVLASETRRIGWYLRVLVEGMVEAGPELRLLERPHPELTIARTYGARLEPRRDPDAVARLAECAELSAGWRERFARLSHEPGGRPA